MTKGLAVFALALIGCAPEPHLGECSTDAQCPEHALCEHAGTDVSQCTTICLADRSNCYGEDGSACFDYFFPDQPRVSTLVCRIPCDAMGECPAGLECTPSGPFGNAWCM